MINKNIYVIGLIVYILTISSFITFGNAHMKLWQYIWHLAQSGIIYLGFYAWKYFNSNKLIDILINSVLAISCFYFIMNLLWLFKIKYAIYLYYSKEKMLCVLALFILIINLSFGLIKLLRK